MRTLYCLLTGLMVAVVSFCFALPMCQAQKTHVNGVACFNNDLNYPYIEGGVHAGTVVDVSSCYVISNDDTYTEVGGTSYIAYFSANEFSSTTPIRIRYYKKTKKILMRYPNEDDSWNRWHTTTSIKSEANNAYYLIRTHLGV